MLDDEAFSQSVYWITPRIALGRYVTPERATYLRGKGVTHVLNVGENPSTVNASEYGFAEIVDCPIVDLTRIPNEIAVDCVSTLHSFLCASSESKAYVHCLAGQRRSPTVAWLYFIARGLEPSRAKQLIEERVFDAVPGHSALVDDELIRSVIEFGRHHLPLFDEDEIASLSQ